MMYFTFQASAQLSAIQNQFSHHAIDYGYQINTISCHKGYEILHNVRLKIIMTVYSETCV